MSSASIPRSVRMESAQADPQTVFEPGQKQLIRNAIKYCSVTEPQIADLGDLLEEIQKDHVLQKRERRALQRVMNKYSNQELDGDERSLVGWVKGDLWDAHRP